MGEEERAAKGGDAEMVTVGPMSSFEGGVEAVVGELGAGLVEGAGREGGDVAGGDGVVGVLDGGSVRDGGEGADARGR